MDWEKLSGDIETAAKTHQVEDLEDRLRELREACQEAQSRSEPVPDGPARTIAKALQGGRYFPQMEESIRSIVATGTDDPQVQRRWIQSLIENKKLDEAVDFATRTLQRDDLGGEASEVIGLLGRAHKQRFVDSEETDTSALQTAIDTYCEGWDKYKDRWHGINGVALLKCFPDAAGSAGGGTDPDALATTILEEIESKDEAFLMSWDRATAAEACIALGNLDGAVRWTASYVDKGGDDAFSIGSTRRQLKEIWKLEGADENERLIVELLDAGSRKAQGGVLRFEPSRIRELIDQLQGSKDSLEANWGQDAAKPVSWVIQGLQWAAGVARVQPLGVAASHGGIGTGFLAPGNVLNPEWSADFVLVTNFHVANEDGVKVLHNTLKAEEAQVTFDGVTGAGQSAGPFRVTGVRWESPAAPSLDRPPTAVDIAVLELEGLPTWTPPVAPLQPGPDVTGLDRVIVIGHPGGQDLHMSLFDNTMIETDGTLMHYRSDARPGNSGSPLFDENWRLIGVHHAGWGIDPQTGNKRTVKPISGDGEPRHANEGFSLRAIQEEAAE